MRATPNMQVLLVIVFMVALAAVAYFSLSCFLGSLQWSFPELF
jgi:hypothetical protein